MAWLVFSQDTGSTSYCAAILPSRTRCLSRAWACSDAVSCMMLHDAATSKDAGSHDAAEVAAGLVSQSLADVLGSEA